MGPFNVLYHPQKNECLESSSFNDLSMDPVPNLLSDCNEICTQNLLVCKQTIKHFIKEP